MQSLAIKYRPAKFAEVVEQSATKAILEQQLQSKEIKNAYLFVGSAGTGKTTCARIFANEINDNKGTPVELDAASNNSVDDIREIIQQAKTTSLDSEYKVFIIDECHSLSSSAWQAMLKILEEPPIKSIFILCTTEPQKIPKTILSRVQRFDFQRISQQGIVDRLNEVINLENDNGYQIQASAEAIEYLAKLANGGMRDALTMLDKCLAYTNTLAIDEITDALGIADYEYMMSLLSCYSANNNADMLKIINDVYTSGFDLKQFIRQFTDFVLNCYKHLLGVDNKYLSCPTTKNILNLFDKCEIGSIDSLLKSLVNLQAEIKWDVNPKSRIEAWCIIKE